MSRLPKPTLRGLAVVLVALGVVTAAAGAGVLGPDARDLADDVSPVDEVEAFVCAGACLAGAGIVTGMVVGYAVNEYLQPSGDAYTRVDANETYTEVRHQSLMVQGQLGMSSTVFTNTVEVGSRNFAWSKAKRSAIIAMNAGENKSVARQWAVQNVSDYYAVTETNILNQWTASMNEMMYLAGVYQSHDSLDKPFRFVNFRADNEWAGFYGEGDFVERSVTLVNGSTVNITVARTTISGIGAKSWGEPQDAYVTPVQIGDRWYSDWIDTTNESGLEGSMGMVSGYNHSRFVPINVTQYRSVLSAVETAEAQMTSNAEVWVNQTYDAYNAGDLNISEIPDPATLAQEFSTSYDSTGFYAYAGADLALMGVGTNLNQSFTVEKLDNGTVTETLHGTLYSNWEPAATNQTWVTDYVYNTSKTNELVYVATNDGLQLVKGEFRLSQMTNMKTGETVNKTVIHHYNQQTSNVSLTMEQLRTMLELRQQIQDAEAAAAGGGGGGIDFGFGGGAVPIGLLVAAGAALVLLKD